MPRKKKKYGEYISLGFRDDGSRVRKYISADTKAEFERLKYEARREAEQIRNPSVITFGKYAEKWFDTYKSNYSAATKQSYRYALKKLLPLYNIPFKNVTKSDLQGIINAHAEHANSCKRLKITLSQIYEQAIQDGIIYPLNLAANLDLPKYICKERRFISDKEMKVIAECSFNDQDARYIDMLRNTGMRPSEALALQWQDIDHKNLLITVRRSFEFPDNAPVIKPTKTGRIRQIPITKSFSDRLAGWPKTSLFIFTYGNGQPFSKSVYRKMARRILRKINIAFGGTADLNVLNGLNMYSFRHTFATGLYYKAVKPGIISTKKAAQIMGHSEEMFLKRYTHIDDDKEKIDHLRQVLEAANL